MTVQELIAALQKCDPNTPVVIEIEGWAMGSSGTGAYETGPEDHHIQECNDLETRVVLVWNGD